MKVFISQPFHGRSESEIMDERWRIVEKMLERGYGVYGDIEVIDNYNKENVPENAGRLWYLGDSIKLMDEADIVVFTSGWEEAKGCIIEREVALEYGIRCAYEDYDL